MAQYIMDTWSRIITKATNAGVTMTKKSGDLDNQCPTRSEVDTQAMVANCTMTYSNSPIANELVNVSSVTANNVIVKYVIKYSITVDNVTTWGSVSQTRKYTKNKTIYPFKELVADALDANGDGTGEQVPTGVGFMYVAKEQDFEWEYNDADDYKISYTGRPQKVDANDNTTNAKWALTDSAVLNKDYQVFTFVFDYDNMNGALLNQDGTLFYATSGMDKPKNTGSASYRLQLLPWLWVFRNDTGQSISGSITWENISFTSRNDGTHVVYAYYDDKMPVQSNWDSTQTKLSSVEFFIGSTSQGAPAEAGVSLTLFDTDATDLTHYSKYCDVYSSGTKRGLYLCLRKVKATPGYDTSRNKPYVKFEFDVWAYIDAYPGDLGPINLTDISDTHTGIAVDDGVELTDYLKGDHYTRTLEYALGQSIYCNYDLVWTLTN